MLWVLLFTAGLIVLLVGVSSLILKGPRPVNIALTALGLVVLGAGTGGVIVKPHLPVLTFADSGNPAPVEKASAPGADTALPTQPSAEAQTSALPAPAVSTPAAPVTAAPPAATPAAPTAAPAANAPAASDKDESQLKPVPLPSPVPVTTTTVNGSPPDPTADPAPSATVPSPPAGATAAAAPAPDAAPAAAAATPAPVAPPTPSDADNLAALASRQPKDEAAFLKIIGTARTAFDKASDERRGALQTQRAAAICAAIKKPDIQSWVGRLNDIDRDPGGRTILSVSLPDGTTLKTWNNAMSDLDDKTLVLAGTPLAAALGKLQRGDAIRFSGSFFGDDTDCYRSTRISLDQSMSDPSFLFRFTALEKLPDAN